MDALASLTAAGVRIVIVSNQAIVARGLATRDEVDAINARMVAALEDAGARIEAVMICPHDAADGCACRKPQPGMLRQAAAELGIDLRQSFMIGDAATDIEAGARAGCETVLACTGRKHTMRGSLLEPAFVARDLVDAATWILMRRAERLGAARAEVESA